MTDQCLCPSQPSCVFLSWNEEGKKKPYVLAQLASCTLLCHSGTGTVVGGLACLLLLPVSEWIFSVFAGTTKKPDISDSKI